MNFPFVVEMQLVDTFETLLEMGLNSQRFSRFGQNFEKFVTGQEVETWEIVLF